MTTRPRAPSDPPRGDTRGVDQRARILTAALEAYGAKGYYATTVQDIEERARISRRTIYAHFSTLDDIRFALFEQAIDRVFMAVGSVLFDENQDDILAEVLRVAFTAVTEQQALARVLVFEYQRPEPRNMELRKRIRQFFVQVWLEGHAAALKAGRTDRPMGELAVLGFLGTIQALIAHCIEYPEERDAAVATVLEIVRGAYPFK